MFQLFEIYRRSLELNSGKCRCQIRPERASTPRSQRVNVPNHDSLSLSLSLHIYFNIDIRDMMCLYTYIIIYLYLVLQLIPDDLDLQNL